MELEREMSLRSWRSMIDSLRSLNFILKALRNHWKRWSRVIFILHYWFIIARQLLSPLKEMLRSSADFLHAVNESENFDHIMTYHQQTKLRWWTTKLSPKKNEACGCLILGGKSFRLIAKASINYNVVYFMWLPSKTLKFVKTYVLHVGLMGDSGWRDCSLLFTWKHKNPDS